MSKRRPQDADGDFPGKALFAGKGPKEVLKRITDGDPLELRARCTERQRERAMFLDGERVISRSFARVAYDSFFYEGKPELHAWLVKCIDKAIDELVNEEREGERSNIPIADDSRAGAFGQSLGIEPFLARRVSNALNALPKRVRRTFMALALEGVSIDDYCIQSGNDREQIKRDVEWALVAAGLGKRKGGK